MGITADHERIVVFWRGTCQDCHAHVWLADWHDTWCAYCGGWVTTRPWVNT